MSSDGDALGILYYTTMESILKPKDYLKVDLSQYLEMVLIDGYCSKNKPMYKLTIFDKEKEFEKELSFFGAPDYLYYDVLNNAVLTKKERIYRILSHVFGGYLFEKIQYSLHCLKNTKKD